MKFDWTPSKHETNLRKRGFGFDFAARIFRGETIEAVDDRQDYGEIRVNAIGEVDGIVLHVTYTDRGDIRWIISAYTASRKDRRKWRAR